MNAISKIRGLFRRKPLTEDDLRTQEGAKLAKAQLRNLKESQLSGLGEREAAERGGRF